MTQKDRLLIINADDLGLAPGVTRGILELGKAGVVTSTSVLINLHGSWEALKAARDAGLDTGVHLNISVGTPLSPAERIHSLVNAQGHFCPLGETVRRLLRGRVRLADVEAEWCQQIETALEGGIRPSHLDSHLHLHAWPQLYSLTRRLARRYGIPGVRRALIGYLLPLPHFPAYRVLTPYHQRRRQTVCQPDHFRTLSGFGSPVSEYGLHVLLQALPAGVTELICHPGYVDHELRQIDPLTDAREQEQQVLAGPLSRDPLERFGIRLVSWAELARCKG